MGCSLNNASKLPSCIAACSPCVKRFLNRSLLFFTKKYNNIYKLVFSLVQAAHFIAENVCSIINVRYFHDVHMFVIS